MSFFLSEFDSSSGGAITVTNCLEIKPNRQLEDLRQLTISEHQTLGGAYKTYKWNDYPRFNIRLEYVAHSDSQVINEWWKDSTELVFTDITSKAFLGRITNGNQPLSSIRIPYDDLYHGVVLFDGVNSSF